MADTSEDNLIIEPTAFSRPEAATGRRLFAPSPFKIAVLTLFIILAAIALFMFNAKAVKFTFTPQAGSLEIAGTWPTYRLGERYLMLSDDYQITASLTGYYDHSSTILVGDEAEQDFDFELSPLPGIVTIKTLGPVGPVEGAEVTIDQELRGVTPLTLDEVEAGTRELSVSHPRYLTYQAEIVVEGKRQTQSESVELSPAWADISINSLPEGADIIIDDRVAGQTPATLEVLEGAREIRLERSGYKVWESDLEVTAQNSQTLPDVVLVKSDGKLTISSAPGGANITINGQYYGQTPLSIALPPKEKYDLLATRSGHETLRRSFSIKPEQDRSLNLKLQPIMGLVKLTVTPAGATLYINSEASGDPNRTLELTARSHEIRVELPGYAAFSTKVIPQPGLPQQLNINLQTEEEARVSSIPQRVQTALGDTLRFIIPSDLKMGAPRREPGRRSNEIEKNVSLTRPYYLGEHEISNKSFKAFDPGHDSGMLGRALLSEDDRPVVNVSWSEAVRFCNWLSEQDGLPLAYEQVKGRWQLRHPVGTGYRLPTEAEWAWAARYANGPKPTRFPWGNTLPPTPGSGNFADISAASMVTYNIKNYNDNFRGPAPSGTYPANAFGIFDLAGNVSEWVNDYYSIELERELLTDPTGPETGEYYVFRGSNYTHGRSGELRWSYREYGSDPRPDVGFRIARYLE